MSNLSSTRRTGPVSLLLLRRGCSRWGISITGQREGPRPPSKAFCVSRSYSTRCRELLCRVPLPMRAGPRVPFPPNPRIRSRSTEPTSPVPPPCIKCNFPRILPRRSPSDFLPVSPPSNISAVVVPGTNATPRYQRCGQSGFSVRFPPRRGDPRRCSRGQ